MPAGHVVVVVVIALALGTLLNAGDIKATAERQPFGWRRSVAVTAITPVHALASAFGLDRPRTAIDVALGRAAPDGLGAAGTAAAATPQPPAFAGPAESPPALSDAVASAPAAPAEPASVRPVSSEDPLRLFVGGDSMVGQFGPALANLAHNSGLVDAEYVYEFSSGLTRPDYIDWPDRLRQVGREHDPEVVVLIFGGNDAQNLQVDGQVLEVGTPPWQDAYRERVAAVMDELSGAGRRVFWVGMPIVRSETFQERVRMLNAIYQSESAEHDGVTYVDSWDLFAGPGGQYAEYLPDDSGRQTDMRLNDGVHLTTAGAQHLAREVFGLIAREWSLPTDP